MNVGIVGCGYISGIHVNAWRDLGMPVAAACDLNEKAAIQFTKEWNIPNNYTDFSEMLKNETSTLFLFVFHPSFTQM